MLRDITSFPTRLGTRTVVAAGVIALAALVAIQAFAIRPAFEQSRAAATVDPVIALAAEAADAVAQGSAVAVTAAAPERQQAGDVPAAAPEAAAAAEALGTSADTQAATGQGLLVDLPPLEFVAGSSELTPESVGVLQALADKINAAPPGTKYEIRTHTDTQGDAAYNQRLSEQRAMVVCDGLIAVGVDQERLSILGVGESAPLVTPELTDADRQANRRVEVVPVA